MTEEARVRIGEHRLMRSSGVATPVPDATPERTTATPPSRVGRYGWVAALHLCLFGMSFLLAVGVVAVGTILFVRTSDNLFGLVLVGISAAGAFVASFTLLRVLLLDRWYPEDTGEHLVGRSVVYGFLALALALLVAGYLIQSASAFSA